MESQNPFYHGGFSSYKIIFDQKLKWSNLVNNVTYKARGLFSKNKGKSWGLSWRG